jgi:uncharacterized RDD family membrane protein YckC
MPDWLTESDDTEESDPATPAYEPTPGSTDGVAYRAYAQAIDWGVMAIPVLVLEILLASAGVPLLFRIPADASIYLVYCVVLEGFYGGQTVGKSLMGIAVVTVEGRPIGLRHALVRNVPALFAGFWVPYIVGIYSIIDTPLHQRVFDRIADTAVVRT